MVFVCHVMYSEGDKIKPSYVFPIPFELPNRNDRSDQCWLRIEDVEVTETVTMYCYVAQAFLNSYIQDYNSRKMTQDGVELSLWTEEPTARDVINYPPKSNSIKDWKAATVMDPMTQLRLYVTKNADCRLVMYSREGMTNYQVDCESILFFINEHMSGSAVKRSENILVNLCLCIISLLFQR